MLDRIFKPGMCMLAASLIVATSASAETPLRNAFTYQGQLNTGGTPVNGVMDARFGLWDAETDGTRVGFSALHDITVVDGLFTVEVDMGGTNFNSDARWLEIEVRLHGGGSDYTMLDPRQPVTAAPYALHTRGLMVDDAGKVGIGTTAPSEMLDVAGTVRATIHNATTHYALGGNPILTASGTNTAVGSTAGHGIGAGNTVMGINAGASLEDVVSNSNSFFGEKAGRFTNGGGNAFFGASVGRDNTTGSNNSFFGVIAGASNTIGSNNTAIGFGAGMAAENLNNATAIGANAVVAQNNSIVLGNNAFVGIGTSSPSAVLDVVGTSEFNGTVAVDGAVTATSFSGDGSGLTNLPGPWNTSGADLYRDTGKVGIGTSSPSATLDVVGTVTVDGSVTATSFSGDGSGLTNLAGSWNINGADVYHDTGNVGIGTSTPTVALDVNGTVRATTVNTATHYALNGNPLLTAVGANTAVGSTAGHGAGAGNTIMGSNAGASIEAAAHSNSMFGVHAGRFLTGGRANAFYGVSAGQGNTTGDNSSFFGVAAGAGNTTGRNNTAIGFGADMASGNLHNATAIGANAVVARSNAIVLGNNAAVGIGTSSPSAVLDVVGTSEFNGTVTVDGAVTATSFSGDGSGLTNLPGSWGINGADIYRDTGNVGIGTSTPSATLDVVGTGVFSGDFAVDTDTLFVDTTLGRVGIGTSSPGDALDVEGNVFVAGSIAVAPASGTSELILRAPDSTAQSQITFQSSADSRLGGLRRNALGDDIFLFNRNAQGITIVGETNDVGIGTTEPVHPLEVGTDTTNGNGAHVTTGGTWTNGSSRTWKTNFRDLDGQELLQRVAALPIKRWNYTGSDEGDHIGPTAEDFHAAFGLGADQRYITTVDADGVALAAIQELHAKSQAKDEKIANLTSENQDIRARLERMEALLAKFTNADADRR